VPMINTSMAAASAARLLVGRAKLSGGQAQPAEKESGSFKQMKQSLNRPAATQPSQVLGNALGQQRSNLPAQQGPNQVAHHQTFGASRINVPRRTQG
jgi:hypothetical protein